MGPGSVLSGLDYGLEDLWSWVATNHALLSPLFIWIFGAMVGFLIASIFGVCSKGAALIRWSPTGAGVRRAALAVHGLVIIRDLWYTKFAPGTVRGILRAKSQQVWRNLVGSVRNHNKSADQSHPQEPNAWPVKEDDLSLFKSREAMGDSLFKKIVDKTIGDTMKYCAMWRALPGNKTEYKSVTVVKNTTAEEMTDFYLDDDCRSRWDGLIAKHKILENVALEDRRQIVHWVRTFPVPFLSNREYVIARRIFKEGNVIFTVTKACEHLKAPKTDEIVRMDEFYSMWSCQTIKCPWGTDMPACEIILYHHEQFKIPERLARLAACKGMWSFVRGMVPHIHEFVEARRKYCSPDRQHEHPYGFEEHSFGISDSKSLRSSHEGDHKIRGRGLIRASAALVVTASIALIRSR